MIDQAGKDLTKIGATTVPQFKNMPTILLDNGHGGIIDGKYQTSGKRSPIWPDGRILYEGEFNRDIVAKLKGMMSAKGYPFLDLVNTQKDIPLKQRTDDANAYYKTNKNCIYLSIHANAGGGTGYEVFTSPGQTKSDDYAELFITEYGKMFPAFKLRADVKSDGDHDKEEKFYVLVNPVMPSVLIECAFMDTLNPDCEMLMSDDDRNKIAQAIFNGIEKVYEFVNK